MTGKTSGQLTPDLRATIGRRVIADDDVIRRPGDRIVLRRAVARALAAEGIVAAPAAWAEMVRALVDEFGGLGPLEPLLRDATVTDVVVNRHDDIWVDRAGALVRADARFESPDHLRRTVDRVLGPLGVRLDRTHPWADVTLPGGVRLHALLPPLAPALTLTLRRVATVVPSWDELIMSGSVASGLADQLRRAVRERRNVVVCGRAGCGKTTLLARLLADVDGDRVIVIEDTPELDAAHGHVVPLRTRPPSPDGVGAVDLADLLRNALRMRPDRIVVGEVRGAEALDMLQAMNTGHEGSLSTLHANRPRDALSRLE
ncbi:MAG: ATPase, T2SS/T4P/T4SS family, partial [Nitriliruptorales bacterium]|nr:ATPase, T2SS/T4P/T4SS family [Nitriliruptorales bacterium]